MLAEAYFAERGLAPPATPGQPPPGAGEEPTEAEIRELVASNLCRCTGYQGIVEAMLATARSRRAAGRP
jgi:aerobic-type carbon monoxide dehydrogenase small subunit (CoxS/CutS family)